jgi:hypothetical protein
VPRELVGEHQAGGAGADDQDVAVLGKGWHRGAMADQIYQIL